jgi:hypothetical protein
VSSEYMTEDLTLWIQFYNLLRCETLAPVRPLILKRARCTEQDLQIIMLLDGVLKKWEHDKAKR